MQKVTVNLDKPYTLDFIDNVDSETFAVVVRTSGGEVRVLTDATNLGRSGMAAVESMVRNLNEPDLTEIDKSYIRGQFDTYTSIVATEKVITEKVAAVLPEPDAPAYGLYL